MGASADGRPASFLGCSGDVPGGGEWVGFRTPEAEVGLADSAGGVGLRRGGAGGDQGQGEASGDSRCDLLGQVSSREDRMP